MPAENCNVTECQFNKLSNGRHQCVCFPMSVVNGKCEYWDVYQTSKIIGYIEDKDNGRAIDQKELQEIRKILNRYENLRQNNEVQKDVQL